MGRYRSWETRTTPVMPHPNTFKVSPIPRPSAPWLLLSSPQLHQLTTNNLYDLTVSNVSIHVQNTYPLSFHTKIQKGKNRKPFFPLNLTRSQVTQSSDPWLLPVLSFHPSKATCLVDYVTLITLPAQPSPQQHTGLVPAPRPLPALSALIQAPCNPSHLLNHHLIKYTSLQSLHYL